MKKATQNIALPLEIVGAPDDSILFKRYFTDQQGRQAVEVENKVPPGGGPPMHVHYMQDECLTVITGTMGIKEKGKPERHITAGETVLWKAGVPHKFWNAGTDTLYCTGWVSPVDSFVFLLAEIHRAVYAGKGKPSMFDIAFLMRRYRTEFYNLEFPAFVQAPYFTVLVLIGKLLGKYKKYAAAPEPRRI